MPLVHIPYFLGATLFLNTFAYLTLCQVVPSLGFGVPPKKWDAQQIPIVHPPAASCTKPGVRKEWRSMTRDQRHAWIRAIKCLANFPSSTSLFPSGDPPSDPIYIIPPINKSSSAYDDFAYTHMDISSKVHQTGLFFPWHRYFVWSFEQTLKQRCNYTGTSPYWDWTKDAHDFSHASIFDPDPLVGLGGFGAAANNYAVTDGAFAAFALVYPVPHTLRRQYLPFPYANLSGPLFTDPGVDAASTFVAEAVDHARTGFRGDYAGFQTYVEQSEGMHMSVHFIVGGDLLGMCPYTRWSKCMHDATPNDPLFWLHHGMMDKIWFDWQHAHPENFNALAGGTVRDLPSWPKYPLGHPPAVTTGTRLLTDGVLFGNYTVADMFNTTSNNPLCYVYE